MAHSLPKEDGARFMPKYDVNLESFHERVFKDITKLRTDKINVGSLMRIVNQKAFSNLSEDFSEVEALKKTVPGLKKFMGHLRKSRSRSPGFCEKVIKTPIIIKSSPFENTEPKGSFKINLNKM